MQQLLNAIGLTALRLCQQNAQPLSVLVTFSRFLQRLTRTPWIDMQ